MYEMMTPGPTQVRENVMAARSREFQNPDLDVHFVEYYKETCELLSSLLHTKNESLILNGEGILGLEAACASLTEPGDRVLVLDNGIYGAGFQDFVRIYGGVPVLYTKEYDRPLSCEDLENFLKKDHNFKYATLVHCDTPSGMLNDIASLCPLLKSWGILTVVDSVSAMFGEEVRADDWKIDILCGGSQKAISAPPGLSLVTLSHDAKAAIENRKTPIASFYASLLAFKGYYEAKWFPYTMPASDIYGLRTALENIREDPDILKRHRAVAQMVRKELRNMGLTLYPKEGYSNTVTVFEVPEGITAQEILNNMLQKHNILLAGSFGCFADRFIRIGHMGENAYKEKAARVLSALRDVLKDIIKP